MNYFFFKKKEAQEKPKLNEVSSNQIVEILAKRLPHISKTKIKVVYHLLQREIKIALLQDKSIDVIGFAKWKVVQGRVKDFFNIFHKEIRKTILPTKIGTKNNLKLKVRNLYKKGEVIENVEYRSLRRNQAYAYRTAQRSAFKAKQNQ